MKFDKIFIILFIINFQTINLISGANILAIFQDPSYSHEFTYHKILRALAARGHQLTIFGSYTFDYGGNPNVTQHVFKDSAKNYRRDFNATYGEQKRMHWLNVNLRESYAFWKKTGGEILHPEMQKIIANEDGIYKFDLMMMECVYCQLALLAEVYDCPIVQLTASEPSVAAHNSHGNDVNPAIYSDSTRFNYIHGNLNFWQRLNSVFYFFGFHINLSFKIYVHYMQKVEKAHPIRDIKMYANDVWAKRAKLLIANTNPEFGHVRPLTPFTIQVGFFHIDEPKELTNLEVKEYLDSSTNGVIVMSFGSKIKTADLGIESVEKFLKAFNQTTHNVLWKFDDPIDAAKIPKNVKLTKWMPLSDVLAHPNVKIIIHHGGLLTCYEAVAREVPQIIFPFVYDEGTNARLLVEKQIAIEMDLDDFDENTLSKAFKDISAPIYVQNAHMLKVRALDQPINKTELIVFHIEKVIRYKHIPRNLPHVPQTVKYLADIYAFGFAILLLSLFILYFISKFSIKYVIRKGLNLKKKLV